MNLSPYPKYKPSDVEWLGDVPTHWIIYKITHGFNKIGSGTTPRSDDSEYYNGDIPWVTTSELRENTIVETATKITNAAIKDYPTLRIYQKGTLLFAMYGATVGRLGVLGIPAAVNQACAAFAEPTRFDTRFIYYWFQMRRPILVTLSAGGGQPNLSQDDLRQIRIPTPPLSEQHAIADFLDRETEKIDTLVEKKRTLIERLKEERTALITHTVTRGLPPEAAHAAGLEPNPKLKSSGVEWLGDVPTHWEIVALRRYAKQVQTGSTPPTVEERFYENGSIPWYGPASFDDQIVVTRPVKMIHESAVREGVVRCFAKGTTLVVTIGATLGKVSSLEAKGSCNQQITAIELDPKIICPRFATYQIKRLEPIFRAIAPRATLPILDQNEIADTVLAFPSIQEQEIIADFLDRETAKIDTLLTKIETAIERLQEYRSTLITATVTGKVDVREEAAL